MVKTVGPGGLMLLHSRYHVRHQPFFISFMDMFCLDKLNELKQNYMILVLTNQTTKNTQELNMYIMTITQSHHSRTKLYVTLKKKKYILIRDIISY
jgi:hypothetical protein